MIIVGQKVWLKSTDTDERNIEATIEKVGRTYFYLQGFNTKFRIDDMRESTAGSVSYLVYLSLQDIWDEEEKEKLIWNMRKFFDWRQPKKLTLDQLRRIQAIVDEVGE